MGEIFIVKRDNEQINFSSEDFIELFEFDVFYIQKFVL